MNVPLRGSKAKLQRGYEHIDALNSEIASHDHSTVVMTEFDQERQEFRIELLPRRPPPLDRWSLIAGDALNNMRTALDYAAHDAIADAEKVAQPKGTSFPIWGDDEEPSAFFGRSKKILARFSADHRAIVERVQPYVGGYGYKAMEPLAVLGRLTNKDKHRLSLVSFISMDSLHFMDLDIKLWGCDRGAFTGLEVDPEKPDTQILRIGVDNVRHDPKVQVKSEHPGQVRLEDVMITETDSIYFADPGPFMTHRAFFESTQEGRHTGAVDVLETIGAFVARTIWEFEKAF